MHVYPTSIEILSKADNKLYLTAEEQLLHYVSIGHFDKVEAHTMLKEWFPEEDFPPIE